MSSGLQWCICEPTDLLFWRKQKKIDDDPIEQQWIESLNEVRGIRAAKREYTRMQSLADLPVDPNRKTAADFYWERKTREAIKSETDG